MSWEVARLSLDMFFSQAWPNHTIFPRISFFGGEPLLEWGLIQKCIEYAESMRAKTGKQYRLAITTNGLSLDDEKSAFLRLKNVDITISFDGVREAQNASRPHNDGRSSFSETRRVLHALIESSGNPSVCAVISPENVEYFPDSIDFFLDEGVRRLVFNPNFYSPWDEEHLSLWRQGYEHAAMRFEQAYRRDIALNINVFTAKIITYLKGGYDSSDCCLFGQNEIAVAPSGRIYPCQRMVGEDYHDLGLLGNVFNGIDVRAADEITICREVMSPECMKCDIRRRCRNWCSCVNFALTGDFTRPGGLICFHEQLVVRIADQVASNLFKENNRIFLETFYAEKHITPEWI